MPWERFSVFLGCDACDAVVLSAVRCPLSAVRCLLSVVRCVAAFVVLSAVCCLLQADAALNKALFRLEKGEGSAEVQALDAGLCLTRDMPTRIMADLLTPPPQVALTSPSFEFLVLVLTRVCSHRAR